MLIRHQTISHRTIELTSDQTTGIGPGAVLRHCLIKCRVTARELVLTDVEMHHCTFVAKKQLSGYKFLRARFYDCAFEGTYSGCDFGKRSEVYNGLGDIARCDFSKTRLDACRFFNCEVDTINFQNARPKLILLQSEANTQITLVPLTPGLRAYLVSLRSLPPECSALIDDVELLGKRLRVNQEELVKLAKLVGAKSQSF